MGHTCLMKSKTLKVEKIITKFRPASLPSGSLFHQKICSSSKTVYSTHPSTLLFRPPLTREVTGPFSLLIIYVLHCYSYTSLSINQLGVPGSLMHTIDCYRVFYNFITGHSSFGSTPDILFFQVLAFVSLNSHFS